MKASFRLKFFRKSRNLYLRGILLEACRRLRQGRKRNGGYGEKPEELFDCNDRPPVYRNTYHRKGTRLP